MIVVTVALWLLARPGGDRKWKLAAGGGLAAAAAALIALGRLFIGAHYPGDVGASVLVAAASALIVVRLGRPVILWLVRLVERATDPILRPLWRRVPSPGAGGPRAPA